MLNFAILKKLINYVKQLRFSWGIKFINFVDASSQEKYLFNNEDCVKTDFFINNTFYPGWYIIEIKVKADMFRFNGRIYFDCQSKIGNVSSFGLIYFSEKMNKRVIFLSASGKLYFDLQLRQKNFVLQHFRLARVTRNFAKSRMLKKLHAIHPHYNSSAGRISYKGIKNISKKFTSQDIWQDYCNLFETNSEIVSYASWIESFDTLTNQRISMLRTQLDSFKKNPRISIVILIFIDFDFNFFLKSIAAIKNQIYDNWDVLFLYNALSDSVISSLLEDHAIKDSRIKINFIEENKNIYFALNSAFSKSQGEWTVLLNHRDVLAEDALFWMVDAINRHPTCRLIYSDEDKIDETGVRSEPYFKPDWNLDLFYSQNIFSHLGVYHADLVREVGGFRTDLEGSQDYDLALRCIEHIEPEQIVHIPRVLYHWRMHADSTSHSSEAKPYAMIAGEQALNEHLDRIRVNAIAESVGTGYRVRYALPERLPLVSLIIPTRNGLKLLRQCIESILEKTTYENYELLIIDNGSDDSATLRYLKGLAANPFIRVIRDDRPFNYSQLNNSAVKMARGEIIGLINNDIEVISPDWLSEMVSHALRPEVGAVGARLWYSDDTIQHAGVVLGVHGIAGHAHRFLPRGHVGYCGRASLIQSFSAVTAACLLVRKSIYEELGGLNEIELQVACNDVDFCLRVREAGYRNIWTPYAELYHHESATRGFDDTPEKLARSAKEVAYMKQRWGDLLQNDPAYSPNLSLDTEDFSLAWPPRVAQLAPDFSESAVVL